MIEKKVNNFLIAGLIILIVSCVEIIALLTGHDGKGLSAYFTCVGVVVGVAGGRIIDVIKNNVISRKK